jgi:hypothetical protein
MEKGRQAVRGYRSALWLVVTLVLSGCGYTAGSLVSKDYRTVYIPIWENLTFRRGLEFRLTELLQKEIERKTHLKVTTQDRADTKLSGVIVDFQQRVLTEDLQDQPVETQVTVVVNFRWEDLRTGQLILRENGLAQTGEAVNKLGGTPEGAGATQAFQDLVAQIVDKMGGGW